MSVLRVGIMSTAAIATKNRRAIVAAGLRVTAVASRDQSRAQAWADAALACGDLPAPIRAHGSYEALLADEEVDAVYMPLPCGLHLPWVLACAKAGKHVLVEKPAAMNVEELETMVRACRDSNVVLLDGTMFHHHPRMAKIGEALHGGRLGELGRVVSAFSFRGDEGFFANNIRTKSELERFGCLGDLAQYSIRFGLFVFAWELPATVRAVAHRRNEAGVPMDVSATFSWPTGGPDGGPRTMIVDAAFTLAFRQFAEVVGTKGTLSVRDFVISRTHAACEHEVIDEPGLDAAHSNVVGAEERVRSGGNQEAAMWRAFAAQAQGAGFRAEWARWTLATQACLDAAMVSMANGGAETPVARPAMFGGEL